MLEKQGRGKLSSVVDMSAVLQLLLGPSQQALDPFTRQPLLEFTHHRLYDLQKEIIMRQEEIVEEILGSLNFNLGRGQQK